MIDVPSVLGGFERRDWLTLFASTAALSVSLLTYGQRARASQFALRRQLTELLQKLSDITLQADTFRALDGKPQQESYPRTYLSLLNDQRRFIVRQAEFVTREIGALVSPYELLLIAAAFDAIDDGAQADLYFQRAVRSSDTPIDRGITRRQYAHFLSARGHLEESRDEFARSVAAFEGDTDDMRLYRIHTYEHWARAERAWNFSTDAERCLEQADAECGSIVSPRRRAHEERRLAAAHGISDGHANDGTLHFPPR